MTLPYFSMELGQAEYYLCRELVKLGHEAWIVTSNRPYPSTSNSKAKRYSLGEEMLDGIHLSKFSIKFQAGIWAIFGKDYKNKLRTLKPEILHSHEFMFHSTYITSKIAADESLPFVLTQHVYYAPLTWYYRIPFHIWMWASGKSVFKNINRYIALAEAQKRYLMEWGVLSDKIDIVPSGVDIELFKPGENRIFGEKVVLSIGHYSDRKIGLYLPVVKELCEEGTEWKFIFVGGGELEEQINYLVKKWPDNIVNHGLVSREKVTEIMRAGDIYVQASKWEIFGLSALEAQASGLPTVVTKEGGLQSIVEHEKTGLLAEKNPQAVKDGLKRLMSDESFRKEMGRTARKRAVERYSWRKVAKRTEEVYERVLIRD